MTVSQAKAAVEQHLLQFFDSLEISVEVSGYNSKVYYIVTQGAGFGDGVYRFPMTGNETVLDALSQINGLRPASSKKIWIARPTDDPNCVECLEVNWKTSRPTPSHGRTIRSCPATAFSSRKIT